MCGIIGYVGKRRIGNILIDGLKRLEYRGYDSAGVSFIDDRLKLKKGVGKIDEVDKKFKISNLNGNVGIGHTRWATHGKVSKKNSHPHTDCEGKIAIVHNGIIENYAELKKILKSHKFRSDTDSEVIAHLIEEEMNKGKDFEKACRVAFSKLKGSFAVLAIKYGEDKIIAARKDSPLVLGIGDYGMFASSDIIGFLDKTKKVVWLKNWDMAVISRDDYKIYSIKTGKKLRRGIDNISLDVSKVEKNGFKHFMLKEIYEQADLIKNIVGRKDIESTVNKIRKYNKFLFTGCGTSYHACLIGKYLFSKFGINSDAILSSEFRNISNTLDKKTLVIALSQSGETADVLEAVRLAKKKGIKVLGMVNYEKSSLGRISDYLLPLLAGPELSVLATKSYTAQIALIGLMAYGLSGNLRAGIKKLRKVQDSLYNMMSASSREEIKKIARKIRKSEHIYIIGRNLNYPTALEAALKIKEVSYIHAEAFSGGELKHGNIALIEKKTPCIVIGSDSDIVSNASEVKSRGGYIIGVSSERADIFDEWIKIPKDSDFDIISKIIPMQILAYHLAVLKGLDPDKPRNLAKSVTVK